MPSFVSWNGATTYTNPGGGDVRDITVSTPSGVSSGDLLVAAVSVEGAGHDVGTPAGWTRIRRDDSVAGIGEAVVTLTRTVTASEPASVTFTRTGLGNVNGIAAIAAYSGAEGVNVHDGLIVSPVTIDYNCTAPSVTPTALGTLLTILYWRTPGNATPPSGMTERVDMTSGAVTFEFADEPVTSTVATGTRTGTISGAEQDLRIGVSLVLAEASGGLTMVV